MKNMSRFIMLQVFMALGISLMATAQDNQTKRLTIPSGKTTVSATGSIKGYQTIDYLVKGTAGQTLSVTLKTNSNSNYFLVYGPNDRETAIYNSDAGEQTWTTTMTTTGDYAVRVYLYRNAARNNAKASYTVTVGMKSAATRPGDAKVPGTKFNATGTVEAALVATATMGSSMADFGVIRYANGEADVHLTNANGGKRIFKYAKGEFKCVSPAGGKLSYTRDSNENWIIKLNGTESYKIPEAMIVGG